MSNDPKEKLLSYFKILDVDHKLLPYFDSSGGSGINDHHILFDNGEWQYIYTERGIRDYICSSEDLNDVLYSYMKRIVKSKVIREVRVLKKTLSTQRSCRPF